MFFTAIDPEEAEKYTKVVVDDRIFYQLRQAEPQKSPRKRYSDQFKDSLFVAKDTNRKLRMLRQFGLKYKDIDDQTGKYISCIEDLIWTLKKEFGVSPKIIFGSFNLIQLGFNPEDYGVELDEEERD